MSSTHFKMHHFILILGVVLLPHVATLKCHECTPSEFCSNTVQQCSASNTHCGALRIITYADSLKVSDLTTKSCTEPELCINASVNFGVSRTVITSKCCTSDLCNAQAVPEPPRSSPNGRKCYTCGGQSCNEILNCEGSEDRCVSASVTSGEQSTTVKGCASKDFCASKNMQVTRNLGTEFTCCQGDYCNSASTSTSSASLLLLVASFIPLITFS